MLKNYMEIAVDNVLPEVLKSYPQICTCEKCVEDMKAIALNSLKPMYVVTDIGSSFAKLNEMNTQFQTDIIKEAMAAVEKVNLMPKHDK